MSLFDSVVLHPLTQQIIANRNNHAFYIANTYFSYGQLADRISAIRTEIQGLDSNERVWGLALHDNLDTYASIFALWMEGKAYVPLHPYQPINRNLDILKQTDAKYVLDSAIISPYSGYTVISTSKLQYKKDNIDNWRESNVDDLAYILFTSGSTGTPKGVTISRRNLAAFMDSFGDTGIHIDETDRCLQCFDLTFDVSVQGFLIALTRGACLYTVPYGQVKYIYTAALITEQHITFGALAPSMLTYLRPYFNELDVSSLKVCILTAEASPISLIEEWYKCASNAVIYDFYGPTETTIYCTYYKLSRNHTNLSFNGISSIGKPLKNVHAIIIDENNKPVTGEDKGELCIAGDQVTQGYWKNEDKNHSSFFSIEGERFYHTGDLCYWDRSGNIMYCGRIDQQVKIQGFRVELGEIEFHAREFFRQEKRAMAIAFENADHLTEIALFVESEPQDDAELIDYLRDRMPDYMIPSRVLYEQSFPLNKSEKVDRNKLREKL